MYYGNVTVSSSEAFTNYGVYRFDIGYYLSLIPTWDDLKA